jgi:photosystem II stability/assembly factor-like uncharacterized protein
MSIKQFAQGRCCLLSAAFLLSASLSGALAAQTSEVSAELMPLATKRSLVLDIADGDQRAIMVGERGHILVSESRTDWRQIVNVPTRATLTAVTTVGDKAWAVGHDGIILHSADGGLSWSLQRNQPWTPPAEDDYERDPRIGAPLLDVLFVDEQLGFAIGAYSLLLRTRDGGTNWEQVSLKGKPEAPEEAEVADVDESENDEWMFSEDELALDEEEDPHLNGMVRTSAGLLLIVAERGAAFRSSDNGESWERFSLPYDGSMFGIIALGDNHLLAYGLRGHALESRDGSQTWQEIDTGTTLSLLGGAALPDAGAVIVGANGVVLHRPDGSSAFTLSTYENANLETPVLSAVRPQGARTFLVAGERGFGRYQVD